jgi:ABC-type amino acid transport substrate-binding protein
MPWPQAVADVRSGRFNAAIGIAGPDAVGMTQTEKPQYMSITCAYSLNKSKKIINSAADLKKLKTIGTVKDYSYGENTDKVLTSSEMKNKVTAIGTDDALSVNIRRLNDGKIEALLEDNNVMSYQLKKRNITNIKKIGCTEDRVSIWIGFTESNPKSKSWIEILNKTQDELEKSGKMAEIYNQYK